MRNRSEFLPPQSQVVVSCWAPYIENTDISGCFSKVRRAIDRPNRRRIKMRLYNTILLFEDDAFAALKLTIEQRFSLISAARTTPKLSGQKNRIFFLRQNSRLSIHLVSKGNARKKLESVLTAFHSSMFSSANSTNSDTRRF